MPRVLSHACAAPVSRGIGLHVPAACAEGLMETNMSDALCLISQVRLCVLGHCCENWWLHVLAPD